VPAKTDAVIDKNLFATIFLILNTWLMRYAILFVILINLYPSGLKAQNKDEVLNAMKLVQKDIQQVIGNKGTAKSCKTQIDDYGKELSAIRALPLNAATVAKYIATNQNFIRETSEKKFNNLCKNNLIAKLVLDVQTSTSVLQALQAASKTDVIKLRFQITDTADKALQVLKVKLDTANRVSAKIIVDTAGMLNISLSSNSPGNKTSPDMARDSAMDKNAVSTIVVGIPARPVSKPDTSFIQMHSYLVFALLMVCVAVIGGLLIIVNALSGRIRRLHAPPLIENKQEEASMPQEPLKDNSILQPTPERVESPSDVRPLYFDFEALLTAGPRKKPVNGQMFDADLGEDACGFVLGNENVLFWLLDGTSDKDDIRNSANHQGYFSSRLLAQSIAGRLKSVIKPGSPKSMDQMVLMIADQVKENWLSYIEALSDVEKVALAMAIKQSKFLECATTIIIAQITLNGQLTVYRSGDSKMFLYTMEGGKLQLMQSPLASKNENSNDRLFFRLLINDDESFNIVFNHPIFEIVQRQNVQTVIVCSDGIGKLTEEFLTYEYTGNPDAIRAEITKQVQATADDKSLCILNIRESSSVIN
jgi:hypothetical protein